MISSSKTRLFWLGSAGIFLMLLGACSILDTNQKAQPAFYSLNSARPGVKQSTAASGATNLPTLIVNPPHAAPGYDSHRIIYIRETHQLAYFSHSEWVDTPARMIAPSVVAALEHTGAFRAVVLTPSAAAGDLRLDVEILRLQHEFGNTPSQVRFTLRAYLLDNKTRQIMAWQEFDETVAAAQEDPYGGVIAANAAVEKAMENLASFCAEVAGSWLPADGKRHKDGELPSSGRSPGDSN